MAASRACNNVNEYLDSQPALQRWPARHNGLTAGIVNPGSMLASSPSSACCAVLCIARVAGMQRSTSSAAVSCTA